MTDQPRVIYVQAPTTNSLAVAALGVGLGAHGIALLFAVFGPVPSPLNVILFGWLPSLLPGLLAIVFGIIGMSTAHRNGGLRFAHAAWGLILGFTPMVMWFLGLVVRYAIFGASGGFFGL